MTTRLTCRSSSVAAANSPLGDIGSYVVSCPRQEVGAPATDFARHSEQWRCRRACAPLFASRIAARSRIQAPLTRPHRARSCPIATTRHRRSFDDGATVRVGQYARHSVLVVDQIHGSPWVSFVDVRYRSRSAGQRAQMPITHLFMRAVHHSQPRGSSARRAFRAIECQPARRRA